MALILRSLAFENSPPIVVKDGQVRKALLVVRIVLQYLASWIELLQFPDQLGLEFAFLLQFKHP